MVIAFANGVEWMAIFVICLLLFGAKRLPELARGLGKAMGEFKSARREFEDEIRRAEYEIKEEPKKIPQQTPSAAPRTDSPVEGDVTSAAPDDTKVS